MQLCFGTTKTGMQEMALPHYIWPQFPGVATWRVWEIVLKSYVPRVFPW